jgi:hypothetical protein
MRLRLILLSLALLAFLSAAIGGYLYYSSVKEAVFNEAERQAQTHLVMMKKNLSSFLAENIKPARVSQKDGQTSHRRAKKGYLQNPQKPRPTASRRQMSLISRPFSERLIDTGRYLATLAPRS